ncbi:hypothetical protein [Streptosporangium sp. NPDC000396]|uniref:hypothetical protein n=1 Tax=Streptosporangium sp. NPDC000396 TaxID=3366185 RepID=UPI00367A10C5
MINDMQANALCSQRHAELIAEAETRRRMPKRPRSSRLWAARTLHGLADRISPPVGE